MKYLRLFKTTAAYDAAIDDSGFPNVSLCEDNKEVHYNPVPPPFFAKLTLNNGEIVKLQGSGELTQAMVGQYQTTVVNAEIGELCTSIGERAFQQCGNLTSVTISNSVINISNNAFNNCSNLVSIVVDSANTVYDSRDNCNAIIDTSTNTLIAGCKNTVIPNTVISIGNNAFYYRKGLTSITIPNSVTSIGEAAFSGCTGLTSIIIPDNVVSIGRQAFNGCSSLTSVTIGSGVTSISDYTFNGCSRLTSIIIPDSVTSIGNFVFAGYSGLTSITIGKGVTKIGYNAFYQCTGLTSIICNATTAPTISPETFIYGVKTGGTLYVPTGSTGYNVWMGTGNFYLGKYGWTKVEQ